MPSSRWNGGVLGPANTPSGPTGTNTASGIWNLERAQVARNGNNWPVPGFSANFLVVAGGGGATTLFGGGGGAGEISASAGAGHCQNRNTRTRRSSDRQRRSGAAAVGLWCIAGH